MTRALLQTTGGKDEFNIGFYAEIVTDIITRNSKRNDILQDNTKNIKYKSNMDLTKKKRG